MNLLAKFNFKIFIEFQNLIQIFKNLCFAVYDELREVLHHKWEAHPYCLVAHVTLRRDLTLPPSDMMHPQLGRSLVKGQKVKLIGSKKSNANKVKKEEATSHSELKCSKCPEVKFENRETFYVHILECAGETEWDVSKKKKKKKQKVSVKNNSIENSGKLVIIY